MAVSLSAGYAMRSDFMISDAALPQRVEEAQADFAGLIAQADAASAHAAVCAQQTAAPVKEQSFPDDPQKLALMIASGEVKLEDIPEELMTVELSKLVEALARMRGEKPREEQEESDEPEKQPVNAQAAAAAAPVQTEAPTDMTAELGEIAKAVAEAQPKQVEAVSSEVSMQAVQPQQPEQALPEAAQSAQTEAVQPEQAAQAFPQEVQTAAQEKPAQPVQTQTEPQNAAMPAADGAEIPVSAPQPQQNGSAGQQLFEQQAAPAQPVQNAQPKAEILKGTEFTVEVKPAQEEAPEKAAQTEMQLGAQAGQGRVKTAADELEMLRGAVKKPEDSREAVRAEAPLMTDTPVVFRAENGRTAQVKPAEVAQQVTDRLIETAQNTQRSETEYTMTLNPEELGKITVKLTKAADGAVSVTIAAENSRTRELLEQNSALMQENLRTNGMRLESWQTVNESHQETYAQDYSGSSKNPYYRSDAPQTDNGEEDGSFAEIMASM